MQIKKKYARYQFRLTKIYKILISAKAELICLPEKSRNEKATPSEVFKVKSSGLPVLKRNSFVADERNTETLLLAGKKKLSQNNF